jgi:hypothetical protein
MTQYLISFGAHAMEHIPGEDMPGVAKAAHACRCAQEVRAIGPDPELDEMLRQAYRRR